MRRGAEIVAVCLAAVVFLGSFSLVYGFDQKQIQALKKSNNCKKCDLSGAKLNNLDLSYADLSGANLSGADLTNTVMSNANLAGANLTGAILTGANFFEANLKGADTSKATLTKAYFDQATWTNGKRCAVGSIGQCK